MTTASWLWPATGFILVVGVSGVTTKLALRHVVWPEIVTWTAVMYAVLSLGLLITGRGQLRGGIGGVFSAITGACAASGLLLTVLALSRAKASTVVPYMASYPLVTILLSTLVLSERLSAGKAVGAALVVAGLILLGR